MSIIKANFASYQVGALLLEMITAQTFGTGVGVHRQYHAWAFARRNGLGANRIGT